VARARLARAWALGSGDPLGELDTYVFSYGEDSFTPARAAAHETAFADRAEAALAAAEEKALRDFVVGLLPTAIRTGWVRMHDWTNQVNRKMRSAAASSQLSAHIQVRINLATDMSEHVRTVYELVCKTFEGDRTAEQDTAVSHALQALINAADGEIMPDKVAVAVNIREWVDVTYEIHRSRWHDRQLDAPHGAVWRRTAPGGARADTRRDRRRLRPARRERPAAGGTRRGSGRGGRARP
jgi:hypothetical protein